MTQEEKAKAYDEAIERSKNYYSTTDSASDIKLIGLIFPELKESEDMIMVKFIKKQLFNIKKTITENYELNAKLTKAIDWLEKQGNLMKALQISNAKIGELIEKNYYLKEQLEKQGEQKMKTPEESLGIDSETYNKIVDECVYGEQKPADKIKSRQDKFTEFEKAVKQVMEEAIECGDTHNLKADADMLLRLVQKSSWSKEDNEIIETICKEGDLKPSERVWFKSLKERYSWKPSDEQMEALKQAKTDACGKPYFNALASLYVNLKGY